ncbi:MULTISPECIES: ABC transporter ATP-binding protein [Clostridium]|uniref:ABC transporter ATP-binding protein YxdL n=1 Tax=Clostridium ragsdalei P11 TaxID=1353534 RepID=A0A1A6AI06_9CLOT|nr:MULTISPECIES: ABC transporter ATP-binding protein [Clostridium]OBR89653.1 ABC transporter ATP-binding protein YxdL [Clostridium ragsdalei P11]QXE21081.1 bacitracin ABC transporter ATP-binding protein [Clostridium sp. 001]
MKVLTVENIKKVYGERHGGNVSSALNGVSFDVEKGEFVGIMGPSGAGKSTLLNVIATIDTPTSGSIKIGNQDIVNLKEPKLSRFRRKKLGFIFQDYNLLDTLTLKENVILPLALSKVKVNEIDERAERIASTLGISKILNKYPYEVSGGQRQRTAAARAIITNPELILADEPTGALDSKSSRELLGCMSELNKEQSATILMVTHDAFAASFCRRIIFIKDGELFTEIRSSGDRKEFFDRILKVLAVLGGGVNDLH